MFNFYKYSFNFNASHSFSNNNIHSHTFRVVLYIETKNDFIVSFDKYEGLVKDYFSSFKGKYLNELAIFKNVIPTLENMATVFYEKINEILLDCDLDLKKLEIGDDYTTSVSIGEIIITGSNCRIIDEDKFRKYKKEVLKKYGLLKEELNLETKDILPILFEEKIFELDDNLLFDNFIKNISNS